MNHKNIVIDPSTSSVSVELDFLLITDHANLVEKTVKT